MPQISLYVDKETMRKITSSARREKKSVSSWVRERVVRESRSQWPEGYFERVFGFLKDSDLEVPPPLDPRHNAPRERM
jgi:hypothetical protein